MFSDPATAVMSMIMLCFGGMIVMFVFIIRANAAQSDELREAMRKQQMVLADLERQVMEMNFALRRLSGAEGGQAASSARGSGLPAQSASRGLPRSDEELSSMLEVASRSGKKLELGDDLLSPPSVSRPLAEEYDPASDPHLFEDSFSSGTGRVRSAEGRVGTAGGKGRTPLSIRLDD